MNLLHFNRLYSRNILLIDYFGKKTVEFIVVVFIFKTIDGNVMVHSIFHFTFAL